MIYYVPVLPVSLTSIIFGKYANHEYFLNSFQVRGHTSVKYVEEPFPDQTNGRGTSKYTLVSNSSIYNVKWYLYANILIFVK